MWLPCQMSLAKKLFYWITFFDDMEFHKPSIYLHKKKHPSRESVPFISSVPLRCFLFQEPDPLPGAGTGGPGGRRGRGTDPGTGGETPGIESCAFPPSFWQSLLWILAGFNADPVPAFFRCCGSGMFIPDPNISITDPNFSIPDQSFFPSPGSASKNLSILTQKLFLSSRKYDPGCSSRIRIQIFYLSRIQE